MTTKPTSSRKTRTASAPEARAVLDPDVSAVMRLDSDLRRAIGSQFRTLWRTKKMSERGIYILELVNAGIDRPSRLIEFFSVLPSTITFETDKLVATGLLVRESDPTDRRVVRLSLTDEGRAVHQETVETINAFVRPALASLSREELEQFLATFHKIVAPLRADPSC